MSNVVRVAVMISGRGSNLEALIRYTHQTPNCPYQITAVVSDQPQAQGIILARDSNIPVAVIPRPSNLLRHQHESAIAQALAPYQPQLIALAGYMRVLSAEFVARYPNRILNIHPSLLPRYPGLATHARALANGDTTHGCSVHVVTAHLDAGPILAQQTCPVWPEDTPETLAKRVLKAEHSLYPITLAQYARPYQNHPKAESCP